MELISFQTLCYVWTALFCSRGYASEEGAVAFVKYACMYRHHYIQSPLNMKDECKRLTCAISERKLTIEVCADSGPYNSSCSTGKVPGKRFPFCCQSRICQGNRTTINGIITHYTAEGAPEFTDYAHPVKSTGHWSAPAKYIFGTCKNGTCRYAKQKIIHETKLTTPCTSVRTYKGNTYIGVEGCPIFSESKLTNCTKLNDGDKSDRYPFCCPVYMCPPRGRERRNSTEWEYPDWHKGMCKYGGTAFADYFSSIDPCRTAICHLQKRAVEVVTCLHNEDLNWTQCKAVTPVKRRIGNHPLCCPDYLCPDMKVRKLPPPKTHTPRVQVDVCIFRNRYFRNFLSTSDTCELYSCDAKKREVKVYSCESFNGTVEKGCTLEIKNPHKPYPDCCVRKVCRHNYSTYFPGSYIAPSHLRDI